MSVGPSIVLLGICATLVYSFYDPNISNGSCYYAPHQLLEKSFYPCGNADGGIIPCCEAGDHCLSSLACYDPDHGTTYLAGCSDVEYLDVLCPNKGDYFDRPWTGMIDCPDDSANWILCDDGYGTTVTNGAPCTCSLQSVAFTDSPTLTSIMFLPAERGDHVTWVTYNGNLFNGETDLTTTFSAGYYSVIAGRDEAPSTSGLPGALRPSSASTSRPSSPSSDITNTASAFPSAAVAGNDHSATSPALKTGEKVGIGIGAAGGACVLGLLIWLMVFCFHRRKWTKQPSASEVEKPLPTSPSETNHNSPDVSDPRSLAFSGHKSELSADFDATSSSPISGHQAHTLSSMTGGSSGRASRYNAGGLDRPAGMSELAGDHDPTRHHEATRRRGDDKDGLVYEMPG